MVDWDSYGYVISSKHRTNALRLLANPFTPSQLASKLKLSLAHGSKIIKELEKKDLVECKNPSAKKGRVYHITNKGKEIIATL